jgi:hypothetical protein
MEEEVICTSKQSKCYILLVLLVMIFIINIENAACTPFASTADPCSPPWR